MAPRTIPRTERTATLTPSTVLAIDVAILVPSGLRQALTRLNVMLPGPPDGFQFDDTHLPHITLAQQFVQTAHLVAVNRTVGDLTRDLAAFTLETSDIGHGLTASTWQVRPAPALVRLHRRLMDALLRFDVGHATLASFVANHEPPRAADLDWVTNYRAQAAYDRFDPHITLGVGALPATPEPARFVATHLVLCHLGRYCTCRRLIARWSLTPSN